MKRRLTNEEAHLWRIATVNVQPLWPRTRSSCLSKHKVPTPAAKQSLIHTTGAAAQSNDKAAADKAAASGEPRRFLVGLDPREKKALKKGKRPIDAVLDLHGFRAQEAHDRLIEFLTRAQLSGLRFVLVITGKGGAALNESFFSGESGILRRQTPHWLNSPTLRGIVGGFEEAAPGHGGGGALYVRLRRRR